MTRTSDAPPGGGDRRGLMAPLAVLALLSAAGCATVARGPAFDAGFVASRDRDLEGQARLRAAGPLVEVRQRSDGGSFVAVRPFYTRTELPHEARRREEYLWPLAVRKEAFGSTFWQAALISFGHDFDNTAPDSRYRVVILPVFFMGRDRDGDRYGALFPIGGTLHEFLGQDRILFVLFPLYAESEVRGARTRHVLWPVFARTRTETVNRLRVFPVYGRLIHEGRWDKRFVLWPFWTSARYQFPNNPGHAWILFPIAGHVALADQETWMVLPPFFRWSRNDTGTREINCPWPFVQYASGPVGTKLYLWPLWGRKTTEHVTRSFWLWPIGSAERLERGDLKTERWRVFPLLYSEVGLRSQPQTQPRRRSPVERGLSEKASNAPAAESAAPAPTEPSALDPARSAESADIAPTPPVEPPSVASRYFQLWPLFAYQREGDHSRWSALSLWPSKPLGPVERNWAPFWTLYARKQVGDRREHEFLWGLFRRRAGPDETRTSIFPLASWSTSPQSRSWSLLGGLVGYQRDGWLRTVRLLYFLRVRRPRAPGDPRPGAPSAERQALPPEDAEPPRSDRAP